MMNGKKILIILNYYYPYVSGVSEYARVLAEELAERKYDVTVLTSNHAKLENKAIINNVKVIRARIICHISKGTISPHFIRLAIKCQGKMNIFITKCMDISNKACLKQSRFIVVQTADYACHSRVCHKFKDKFAEAATPIKNYKPVPVPHQKNKVIGFCGRLVEEKGIDVLLKAYRILYSQRQDIELWIGGDYKNVAGGSIYESLTAYIQKHDIKNVVFWGRIPEDHMEEFYSSLDVFVLPSINSLEAFGMVQVEAMYCGTPVVSTNLYGVRTILQNTGMGISVLKNNPESLAKGVSNVLNNPQRYIKPKSEIEKYYSTHKCITTYEHLITLCREG